MVCLNALVKRSVGNRDVDVVPGLFLLAEIPGGHGKDVMRGLTPSCAIRLVAPCPEPWHEPGALQVLGCHGCTPFARRRDEAAMGVARARVSRREIVRGRGHGV